MLYDNIIFKINKINIEFSTSSKFYRKNYAYYKNKLYFEADFNNNKELWVSDGTHNGTYKFKEINSTGSSLPHFFYIANNLLFFGANDGINGVEIWVTDGTPEGTKLLNNYVGLNNNTINGSPGEIISSTVGGYNVRTDEPMDKIVMIEYYSKLFFSNEILDESQQNSSLGLLVSDGTQEGTNIVRKGVIDNSTSVSYEYDSLNPRDLLVFNNKLYYSGQLRKYNFNSLDLMVYDYKKDLSPINPMIIKEKISAEQLISVNNKIYFVANQTSGTLNDIKQVWVSDGTSEGTIIVKNINQSNNTNPKYLTSIGNLLYFVADNGTNGYELWVLDTNNEIDNSNPKIVKNMIAGSEPKKLFSYENKLYFTAKHGTNSRKLWSTDGTEIGTNPVSNISWTKGPYSLVICSGLLYFIANDGTGLKLWNTNGTESGTIEVNAMTETLNSTNEKKLIISENNKLYFYTTNNSKSYLNILSHKIFNWGTICFPKNTPVKTDQGEIYIQNLNKNYTINKNPIKKIIKTLNKDNFLILFKKNSLKKDVPLIDTFISKNHGIFFGKNKMKAAYKFINNYDILSVYTGHIPLYNVLLYKHYRMNINNIIVETLNPNNKFAKI